VGGGKHGRSSAAEINGLENRGLQFAAPAARFAKKGVNEACQIGIARSVLVERAIRANAVAEGDVEIEVQDVGGRR
jgi:hypothetical protein